MNGKLTKRTVDSVEADPQRDVFLWDSELKGFGLRVKPSGIAAYVIQYRPAGSRTARRLTLAKAGTVTVEEARQLARVKLAEVVQGGDPAADKADRREEPTVRELVVRFKREHVAHLKPSTRREYERLLDDVILKAVGSRQVSIVTRGDIAKMHHEQADHPSQANKVLAVAGKLFSFAEAAGLRPDGTNPAKHVKKYAETKRERYLSEVELYRLGKAITDLEAEKKITAPVALLFRLLLTTGCRVGEWLGARWEWVDLDRGLLLLPDSKTGQKAVTLSAVAVGLLRRAPHEKGSPWVTTTRRRDGAGEWTHLTNPNKSWYLIRDRASAKEDHAPKVDLGCVRIHDLRHSFASVGAGAGLSLPVIGALLGHSEPSTTKRYSHLADSPLRNAADLVAGEVWAAMNAAPPADVVNMPTKSKKRSR